MFLGPSKIDLLAEVFECMSQLKLFSFSAWQLWISLRVSRQHSLLL